MRSLLFHDITKAEDQGEDDKIIEIVWMKLVDSFTHFESALLKGHLPACVHYSQENCLSH